MQEVVLQRSLPMRVAIKVMWRLIPSRLHPGPFVRGLAAARTQSIVQAGPFRGMQYIDRAFCSSLVPKWLGTYERELADCVEEAIALPFHTVVDIGAAEGYYAVGLALRMREARVVAFEMDSSARELLNRLILLNGVEDRVTIEKVCTTKDLSSTLTNSGMALVVCDAEGAESVLLDPIEVPELKACHILVELHDFVIAGISEEIRDRFSATHSITHVWQEDRERGEFPYQTLYTRMMPKWVDLLLSEGRPCRMAWYWIRPNKPGLS